MKESTKVYLGWRLAILPVWQRMVLFILFFIVAYPVVIIVLLGHNIWRGITHFCECFWLDVKDESLPWWKTFKVLKGNHEPRD